MNTASDDADSLFASLKSSEHYQGLYLRFASFFRPFEDFVSFDDYNPNAVKKRNVKKKSPKNLLSKEKIRPIAKQFHYFLCKSLKLLPDLLRRSPSNGAEDEEKLSQEGAAELLGIYRLTIRCLLCIAPCLSGQPYMVHVQWGQLVRRLETWDKYDVAEEEGVSLIESLCDVLVTSPPFKQSELFLPDPSKVGSPGKDPQLACLVFEVVIVLTYCVCKSQSRDTSAYERILTLAEQVQPWIRIIELKAMAARHNIFVDALYRCALFLAKEVMSFDDILVQRFCIRMLKECLQSPSVDCFPLMAHRVCSSIDVKWEKRTSLVVDLLIMSMEVSYSGDKVNLAKYVDGLFDFTSNCAEGLYLTWRETCKSGSGLMPKIALHQVSIALELCCKAVWVHINLLRHMQLENSSFLQDVDEFADPIEGLVNDAYTKSARIIDIMYRCGAANTRNVLVETLYELSIVEFSSLTSSLSFPLVKQWVKMLCKDFKDANEVDEVPVLYSLMLSRCPTWSNKILGEILEQELLAYNQLDSWNSDLFRKMEIKVIDKLLMDVFTARDFSLQRSRILVQKAVALRTHGVENLNNCFECLREAIALLDNGTNVSSDDNTLVYHQLGFAHLLCAHLSQEAQQDWESIQFDVHRAICLLTKIEFAAHHSLDIHLRPSLRSTIYMMCDILDLLSLKGFLKFHFDLYSLISKFCNLGSLSILKCLAMLCASRKLGHSLCTSPIDEELASRISERFNNDVYSISIWTDCLKDTPYNLLMFLHKMFLSDSIVKEEDISIIESLYSCKLTVDEIKVVAASLLLEIPAKIEMSFIAGQIYHDLAERLFTSGRFFEALSYAKEALNFRYKIFRKKFILINKKPTKLSESPAGPKSEFDHLHFEMLGLTAAEVWRDNRRIESCFLGPWSILSCYLESILQVGVLHEATGDSVIAEKLFLTGKRFSILQCLPIFGIAFTSALGKLYCNKLLWDAAENELNIAKKLLQENEMISCKHCKLIFEVEIDIQLADLSLGCSNKDSHIHYHALDMYQAALKKLSDNNLDSKVLIYEELDGVSTSFSKCRIKDLKTRVIEENNSNICQMTGKQDACSICSILKHNLVCCDVGKLCSDGKSLQSLGRDIEESYAQMTVNNKSRYESKHFPEDSNIMAELKPRRSSRNRSLHVVGHVSTVVQNKGSGASPNGARNAIKKGRRKQQSKENKGGSLELGCSEELLFPRIKCLRCCFVRNIKEGTMQNIIYFKQQYERRRLLSRILLKIAKSLGSPGVKHEAHEIHSVFFKSIKVLFAGRLCLNINSPAYDLSLIKLIGNANIGDIFSAERAAILFSMSWFVLKNVHPENSSKCCSLFNVQMHDIISWLLGAFILCREIPILFQKVSELLASLILISSIDGSIPLPLCSRKSLSLSHWAAFFHQASIGAVVHSQYHSFMTDKGSIFKTCEVSESKSLLKSAIVANGISRYLPAKLENLGECIEDFYKDLPRISIVCISLLGCDYVNLLGEMLILPSFFPAWLLITRLEGINQPISMFLPADSVLEDIQLNSECKEPVCESMVPVSAWTCPWKSAVIDDVVPSYRLILAKNFCSLSSQAPGDQSEARLNYMKWWCCRKILDNQLRSLLKKIEDAWIGQWGCLLLGGRLNNESLETVLARLFSYLKSECNFEVNDTLLRIILSGAQSVCAAEVCIAQLLMYRGHFGRGGCCGEQRFRAFSMDNCDGVKRMLACIKNLLPDEIDERLLIDRQPMILVLDSNVQMLSWENMPVLQNQEVYRMPSVGSILLKLNLRTPCPKKGVGFEIDFPSIDPSHAYYLLNPSGDLNYTQQEFEEWFRNQKWEGKVGVVPTNEELLLALQNHDLFLYFGHGSGMQYMRADSFEKLDRCAAAFLMGCSSGCLRQSGSYAPQGAPLHYLFAGSPSVIANLWEVSDKDIDRFAKAILNSWIQDSNKLNSCGKCCELGENSGSSSVVNNSTRKGTREEKQGVDRFNCRDCEAKPRVASFIGHARGACKLPSIIGASVVCYGVPTVLRRKQ